MYARIAPEFWTGPTGRHLKELGIECQLLALYLISCPSAHSVGVFYLPLVTLSHETGLSMKGASKALRSLFDGAFCAYDGASETVHVYEMARFQLGETITPKDKRHGWIVREAEKLRKSVHFTAWYGRYKDPFFLPKMEPLASPLQAPCKPLPSFIPIPIPIPNEEKDSPRKNGAEVSASHSWITPYEHAWRERFPAGSLFVIGEALRRLAPLRAKHGDDRLRIVWCYYLRHQDEKFVGITNFAKQVDRWLAETPSGPDNGYNRTGLPPGPILVDCATCGDCHEYGEVCPQAKREAQ